MIEKFSPIKYFKQTKRIQGYDIFTEEKEKQLKKHK